MVPLNLNPHQGQNSFLLHSLLLAEGALIRINKGGFLFRKGAAPSVFMLEKGRMVLAGPSVNSIQILNRTSIIGVAESLAHTPWGYSGFAVSPVIAYRLSSKDLVEHFNADSDFRKQCMQAFLTSQTFFE